MSHNRRAVSSASEHRDGSPVPKLRRLASSKADPAAGGSTSSGFFFMVVLDAAGASTLGVNNRPGGVAAPVTVNGVELRATGIVDGCDLRRHLRALTDGCLAAVYTRDSDGNEGHGWHEPDGGDLNFPSSEAVAASSSSTCYACGVVLTPVAGGDALQRAAALRAVVAALGRITPQERQTQQPAAHCNGKWVLHSALRRDPRDAFSAGRSSSPERNSAKALVAKLRECAQTPQVLWAVVLATIVGMTVWGTGWWYNGAAGEREAARLRLVEAVQRGLGPARLQCACFVGMDKWPVDQVADAELLLPQLGRIDALVESEPC